jgi:hypothetical protein
MKQEPDCYVKVRSGNVEQTVSWHSSNSHKRAVMALLKPDTILWDALVEAFDDEEARE